MLLLLLFLLLWLLLLLLLVLLLLVLRGWRAINDFVTWTSIPWELRCADDVCHPDDDNCLRWRVVFRRHGCR